MDRSRTAGGVVVVGAGAAGASAVTELRRAGYDGPLTVVGAEPLAPYNRTTVNKGLLQGTMTLASVALPVPDDDGTTWLRGVRAVSSDLAARVVRLDDGRELAYDALLVATGASPRPLPVPVDATAADRVHVLRTAGQAAELRDGLATVAVARGGRARVAVVGAGVLGSELADTLAADGHAVSLLSRADLPMHAALGDTVAGWLRRQQEQALHARYGSTVEAVASAGTALRLDLAGAAPLEVDLVVVALGVTPAVGWLAGGALTLDDGVVVDPWLRARGATAVYAAGDLARPDASPRPSRVEHWGHALAQGAHAGKVIAHDLGVADDPGPFTAARSFATRLHGKAVNVLGSRAAADREVVLAGDVADSAVTVAFVDASDRVCGAVSLGSPKVANRLRPVVAAGGTLEQALDVLQPAPPTAVAP